MTGEPILAGRSLIKRFGGLVATDSATIEVFPGETCALIGPNGAGKTTLIGLLTGEITPDAGAVYLNGKDVTRLRTDERARSGIGRSFQITSIFPELTALQNVCLAVQVRAGHSFSFFRPARSFPEITDAAAELLGRVGLSECADEEASTLSHGEHRRLEIALTLASRPQVLLFDEPMAGLGPDESRQMVALLAGLKGQYSVLLIEHDMDAVFALADRISVLVYGRVLASGSPSDIRGNPEVRAAYLGDGEE